MLSTILCIKLVLKIKQLQDNIKKYYNQRIK